LSNFHANRDYSNNFLKEIFEKRRKFSKSIAWKATMLTFTPPTLGRFF